MTRDIKHLAQAVPPVFALQCLTGEQKQLAFIYSYCKYKAYQQTRLGLDGMTAVSAHYTLR